MTDERKRKTLAEIDLLKCQSKALAEECRLLGTGISENQTKQLVADVTQLISKIAALILEVSDDK